MILVIHKKKLIIASLFVFSLFFLAYVDLKERAESFFTAKKDGIITVVLDAGHGGEDPGAVSDVNMAKEKDINLKIVTMLKDLLEKEHYRVLLTRSEDILKYEPGTGNVVKKRKQDLETRKKFIDESGADITVSIHLNKFPQTDCHGAQVFFPPNFPDSRKLGDNIQRKIREVLDPTNKREALVKKEPIILLKNPKVVTAIVECGFLSNPQEESQLVNEDYQKKIAEAVKEGIKAYFNQT